MCVALFLFAKSCKSLVANTVFINTIASDFFDGKKRMMKSLVRPQCKEAMIPRNIVCFALYEQDEDDKIDTLVPDLVNHVLQHHKKAK